MEVTREFAEAKVYFDRLDVEAKLIVQSRRTTAATGTSRILRQKGTRSGPDPRPRRRGQVVALDSTKPDLEEGEVGWALRVASTRSSAAGRGRGYHDYHTSSTFQVGTHVNTCATRRTGPYAEMKVDWSLRPQAVPYVWSIRGEDRALGAVRTSATTAAGATHCRSPARSKKQHCHHGEDRKTRQTS